MNWYVQVQFTPPFPVSFHSFATYLPRVNLVQIHFFVHALVQKRKWAHFSLLYKMKIVGDTHLAWSRHSRLRTEYWYLAWDRYNLSVSMREANWALKLDMNFYSTLQTWPKTCLVKRATMLVQNPPKQQKIKSINFHVKAHSPPLFLSFIF